jgi:prevent-host-death family protein
MGIEQTYRMTEAAPAECHIENLNLLLLSPAWQPDLQTASRHSIFVRVVRDVRFGGTMPRLKVSEARDDFAEVINRVAYRGERILLQRRGRDVVAMVPVEDMALIEMLEDRIDITEARRALEETRKDGTIAWEELKTELGI